MTDDRALLKAIRAVLESRLPQPHAASTAGSVSTAEAALRGVDGLTVLEIVARQRALLAGILTR